MASFTVDIAPRGSTKQEFAIVRLRDTSGTPVGELDVEFTALKQKCWVAAPVIQDFLLFASVVYALDKIVRRDSAADLWTREFDVQIPVDDPILWTATLPDLLPMLSFLTGDLWTVEFVRRTERLYRPRIAQRASRRISGIQRARADCVCLFSGGLDSLIGAIDWLASRPEGRLLLVGHHDGQVAGPKSDQNRVIDPLRRDYPARTDLLQVRIGEFPIVAPGASKPNRETTFRSRSLVFLALGLYAASQLGDGVPILIPENGTIALNVRLTPSRRGSCSTRTAHPYFLRQFASVVTRLGLNHPIENPLLLKTKGECVSQCLNPDLLRDTALASVSCAKRGHKVNWIRTENVTSCGWCMPCIYRRAALHAAGLDTQPYGRDLCRGEVHPVHDAVLADDVRACFSFLGRRLSREQIAFLLLGNGALDRVRLNDYAAVVERAMEEIRQLLRDKALPEIQRYAGVDQN